MHISSQVIGNDHFTNQLQIAVVLGLPVELKMVFYSSGRDQTSVEIFDQFGASMGRQQFVYGMGMYRVVVENLNVLLEEFSIQIDPYDFSEVCGQAHHFCDGRYGSGIQGGDVVVTIH
jgi:hypothetical protein